MAKLMPDIIIAGFIWAMLYFMFKPAQNIMLRAAEDDSIFLEVLVVAGFAATVAADLAIRSRIRNKKKDNGGI